MIVEVELNNIKFKNPILPGSGTFGMGDKYQKLINKLGGFITKAITLKPRTGNPYPRLYDGENFIINSIGLENPGVKEAKTLIKKLELKTNLIVNVAGESIEEYRETVRILNDIEKIDIFEINLSCPNVESGKIFSHDIKLSSLCIRELKKITNKPLWAKISGMWIDPIDLTKSLIEEGIDGITVMNTLPATVIDVNKRGFYLGGKKGGLSGPPLKHISLLAIIRIREKYQKIPIIGSGGIIRGTDIVEYILAGANLVQIGSANLIDKENILKIYNEFLIELDKLKINNINNIRGKINY